MLKRKIGIRNAWKEKKRIKEIQEMCVIEWKGMIAEAARKGEEGEASYEWDSYISIRRCLQSASKPEKKKQEVVRRGNLSTEHRLKISEAIKAKWSDPVRLFSEGLVVGSCVECSHISSCAEMSHIVNVDRVIGRQ